MRGWSFVVTLTLVSAVQVGAQSSVRPGGSIQGGPGRVVSPLPATPSPGLSTVTPGKPDARLGAGGIRPFTGNIIYPGTPGGGAPGNILSPGIPASPATQPIPSIVQPTPDAPRPEPPRGGGRHPHGRRFIGAYPIYGVYAYPMVPNVIEVPGSTVTRSGTGYVVNVGEEQAQAQEQAEDAPADQKDAAYWLVALRGGLIYAVSDYVIEERAFRFVTLQGDEYVVPLAELDREFTVKLNRDRGVTIDLE
jgi:hypothetical protein